MFLIEKVKEENEHLVDVFKYYLNQDFPIDEIESVRQEILSNKYLMNVYLTDSNVPLVNDYIEKVSKLREKLFDSDKEQNIANCLEYIRFTCMNENFFGINGVKFFENLSDSQITACILGKATSNGQSKFLRDLLQDSIKLSETKVDYYRKQNEVVPICSDDALLVHTKMGDLLLDPSLYSGTDYDDKDVIPRSFNGSFEKYPVKKVKQKQARNLCANLLSEELHLDDVIESITRPDMKIRDKNKAFVDYINKNKVYSNIPVKHNSVIISGRQIEASKLLELFYIRSQIPYNFFQSPYRENSVLTIKDENGDMVVTDINKMLSKDKSLNNVYKEFVSER